MHDHRAISLSSPDSTTALAQTIARQLNPGDVLLLSGPVGAGKTHFARAVIQELLQHAEDVPSPTFTLVQIYDTPDFEIWHSDLYRLSNSDEIVELGLDAAFETAVCLVEWPDRLGDLAPENALYLEFSHIADTPDARMLRLTWTALRWSALGLDAVK